MMTNINPASTPLLPRLITALNVTTVVAALSVLLPLTFISAPSIARGYVRIWKIALGYEPAPPFRLMFPDCPGGTASTPPSRPAPEVHAP